MYEEFFNFSAAPFRLNPDPKFFFGSRSHNKAMAYLHYGLRQAEGFIVITGEIGAGKSILIGHLIDQLDRSNVVAAHLLTTSLEPSALLSHILSAFRIEPSGAGKSAEIEAFEDFLFDQMNRGRRVLLIVDEAQNLPIRTMEELRMLSNMDYDGTPLFQVFMVGQPEFRGILAEPHMEQFRQRIIASYHLEPLGQGEATDYIRHRLALVGWNNDPSITDEAYRAIFLATGGVPRKINKLCNRILLYCSLEKLHAIDEAVVKAVVTDLRAENLERHAQKAEAAPAPAPAIEPAPPKKAEEAKAVAPAQREAKAANGAGATNGARAVKPAQADKPAAPRAPVVIPFGSVKKVTPAASENGAGQNTEQKAEQKAEPEKKPQAPRNVEAVEKPAAKAEAKAEAKTEPKPEKVEAKSGTKTKPEAKAETPAKVESATKPAEREETKSKAAGEGAMPKKTETAPPAAAPAPAAAMSVLDRLRAQRAGAPAPGAAPAAEAAAEERESERSPATLLDVAKAIEAISAAGEAARKEAREAEPAAEVADDSDADADVEPLGEPPLSIDPKGWRLSIVKSINETRDELKTAHANVARLRKQLGAIDSRRREKRLKIAANLARAESLLAEIRNAWR